MCAKVFVYYVAEWALLVLSRMLSLFFRVCAECTHASVKQHDCMTVCIVEETPTTDEWQGDRIETRFGWRER